MNILPHRDAMLLLNEAESRDGAAVGRYHVRGDEFFLQGHFPAIRWYLGSFSVRSWPSPPAS